MKGFDIALLLFVVALFVLNLYPLINEDSENVIIFLSYAIVLVPIYESYVHGKYEFLSLIITTLAIHLIADSCNVEHQCISSYENANFSNLDKYFTLYGLLHLISYVSLEANTVAVFVPILVFVSLLAVNLAIDSMVLAVVGMINFIVLIQKADKYHIEDLVAFTIFIFLAALFYFMKEDKTDNSEGNGLKRWFLYFYFLAFSISTGIKKEGVLHGMRLFTRFCGGEEKSYKHEVGIVYAINGAPKGYTKVEMSEITRVDLVGDKKGH